MGSWRCPRSVTGRDSHTSRRMYLGGVMSRVSVNCYVWSMHIIGNGHELIIYLAIASRVVNKNKNFKYLI